MIVTPGRPQGCAGHRIRLTGEWTVLVSEAPPLRSLRVIAGLESGITWIDVPKKKNQFRQGPCFSYKLTLCPTESQ